MVPGVKGHQARHQGSGVARIQPRRKRAAFAGGVKRQRDTRGHRSRQPAPEGLTSEPGRGRKRAEGARAIGGRHRSQDPAQPSPARVKGQGAATGRRWHRTFPRQLIQGSKVAHDGRLLSGPGFKGRRTGDQGLRGQRSEVAATSPEGLPSDPGRGQGTDGEPLGVVGRRIQHRRRKAARPGGGEGTGSHHGSKVAQDGRLTFGPGVKGRGGWGGARGRRSQPQAGVRGQTEWPKGFKGRTMPPRGHGGPARLSPLAGGGS